MKQPLSFECALITGGKSGLGKGLADFLEEKGIRVMTTSSSDYDLRDEKKLEELLTLITREKPDLIINNAGIGFYGDAIDHSLKDQLDMIEINITALTAITLHGAKVLRDASKKGVILNISSAAAFTPFPTFSIYSASKSYVNQFSLGIDQELRDQGIRVLCACPGQIATSFRKRASKGQPQKPDRRTMSINQVVCHLWNQIQSGKCLMIFDWRSHLMLFIAKLFPKRVLGKFLQKLLSKRY